MGHYFIKKKKLLYVKYVKCRTILVLTKKSYLDLRSDSKVNCKMINSWNPFIAVRSIAADLQARRFEGHLRTEKLREES